MACAYDIRTSLLSEKLIDVFRAVERATSNAIYFTRKLRHDMIISRHEKKIEEPVGNI